MTNMGAACTKEQAPRGKPVFAHTCLLHEQTLSQKARTWQVWFDDHNTTWIVHLWLVNDSVSPPAYLHVPAILDTKFEGELSLPLREAQKLRLTEDPFILNSHMLDDGGHSTPQVVYKPVAVLLPMLDKPDGQLSFYKAGRIQPQSSQHPIATDGGHSQTAEQADKAIKAAGQAAIKMIQDKSGAWVQLRPAKHPGHDQNTKQPLLGLAAIRQLGLHLDRANGTIRTPRMRTIIRAND